MGIMLCSSSRSVRQASSIFDNESGRLKRCIYPSVCCHAGQQQTAEFPDGIDSALSGPRSEQEEESVPGQTRTLQLLSCRDGDILLLLLFLAVRRMCAKNECSLLLLLLLQNKLCFGARGSVTFACWRGRSHGNNSCRRTCDGRRLCRSYALEDDGGCCAVRLPVANGICGQEGNGLKTKTNQHAKKKKKEKGGGEGGGGPWAWHAPSPSSSFQRRRRRRRMPKRRTFFFYYVCSFCLLL